MKNENSNKATKHPNSPIVNKPNNIKNNKGASCYMDGRPYSDGSTYCYNGELLQCNNGEWVNLRQKC